MSCASKIVPRISEALKNHPRKIDKHVGYGTAGFRTKGEFLDHVMFRMGIVASLRSKVLKASVGVMITASHNPEEDNGCKLVDSKGEMLEAAWEEFATGIANVPDENLTDSILNLIETQKIDLNVKGSVVVGRDTRSTSEALSKSLLDGIRALSDDTEIADFGVVSTPILHYLVVCKNDGGVYGAPTVEGYYEKIGSAFKALIGPETNRGNYEPNLIIDGANGVGAIIAQNLLERLNGTISTKIVNTGAPGILNHECGADHVKVQQREPLNVTANDGKCASLDGDADRLIYFYFDAGKKFRMLDGDKIALLYAKHFNDLLIASGLNLKLGMVQTAYANGSSTNFAKDIMNIPVECTPTGVKHLHHKAQNFDIGVYFEANGHGTVVFSDKALKVISEAAENKSNKAAVELAEFLKVINSTVGDAISDMLGVEAILHSKGWSMKDWDNLYEDLPNKLVKVAIPDRNLIKTTDAERQVVSPEGLQDLVNALVSKYKNGRSFVRPSGTEDVVRVYAEADTKENADRLAEEVANAVREICAK